MSRQTFSIQVHQDEKTTMVKVVVQSNKDYPPGVIRDLALAMAGVKAEGAAVVAGMVRRKD